MFKRSFLYGFALALLMFFFVKGVPDRITDHAVYDEFRKYYKIFALPLPDTLDFAGEPVPMDRTEVRERLDKELLINVYWQSSGLLKIKRAAKYFPVFEPYLKQYGIPEDFKYLAVAESNLEHVKSPAGAAGIWQLMKQPARSYGLIVNNQIDQRYDVELATEAACRYLKDAYERFGSWTLAAAAYNRGMQGLQKAIDDQEERDYYRLYLNPETARYVYRILAAKMILENPRQYGFYVREKDKYRLPPMHKIMVDSTVHSWPRFARRFGLSYGQLRYYNPFIRDYEWDNEAGDTIYINIPAEEKTTLIEPGLEIGPLPVQVQ